MVTRGWGGSNGELMCTVFQLSVVKKFWKWMVVMFVQ